jgi:hypothetical protein
MTPKSRLFSRLLIPVWLALVASIGCVYWGFQFDAVANSKEAKFISVERQLSAVNCTELKTEVLLSIARQTYESPRDVANIFRALAGFILFIGVLNLFCVWKYLMLRPVSEDSKCT